MGGGVFSDGCYCENGRVVSVKCTVPCYLYGMDIIMSLIRIRFKQCCGSGSVFRIFVDPDPYSQYGPGFTEENI